MNEITPASQPEAESRPRFLPRWHALAGIIFLVIPMIVTLALGDRSPDAPAPRWLIAVFAIAILIRVLLLRRSGAALHPLIDLPVIGLVFLVTGGVNSPFDPALYFIYALLASYLERQPRRMATTRYAVGFVGGFLVMYALVYVQLVIGQEQRLAVAASKVDQARADLLKRVSFVEELAPEAKQLARTRLGEAIADLSTRAWIDSSDPYFRVDVAPTANSIHRDLEIEFEAIEARRQLLERAIVDLIPTRTWPELAAIEHALGDAIGRSRGELDEIDARISSRIREASAVPRGIIPAEPVVAEASEARIREAGFRVVEQIQLAQERAARELSSFAWRTLEPFKDEQSNAADARRRMWIERSSLAALLLAALVLITSLRTHYESEVRRRETARSEQELARRQEETENWIALTAGFTHTIGNDILAYDAFSEEALALLDPHRSELPQEIERNLRFIRHSNKQRLGFIKFLEEFGRMRKLRLEGKEFKPTALARIDVEDLLRHERAHVGEVEVLDFPAESRDPRVLALRTKFGSLPLEIEFETEEARWITRGRMAVIQFFAYELFKNALRNCSGQRPLRVEVRKDRERVRMRFLNDLEIAKEKAPRGTDSIRYRLPRLPELDVASESELERVVADVLARCFDPGRAGGTGLGLFLIRHFIREYYGGSITAKLHDWSRREVAFEIDIPDDLSAVSPASEVST